MGYIKRTSLEEYKAQGRGGVGNKGVRHRDEDFTEHLFIANAHNYMLYFTEMGRCYWQKVYEIPVEDIEPLIALSTGTKE